MRKKHLYTIETLMRRTVEVGNCIEWTGYCQNKTPYVQHGDRFLAVRRLVMELLGKDRENASYGTSCGNRKCVNPDHIVARSLKTHMAFMSTKMDHRAPSRRIKLQQAAEKRRVLNDDQVKQILVDQRTCAEIAKDFNVSKSLISRIKRGQSNRLAIAKNNPFWGLMA